MTETPAEKKFAILCKIARAQHFAWREAVRQLCPGIDPADVVQRMWEITGRETARAYAGRIDRSRPLAEQVAEHIAWSSRCMGEEVTVQRGETGDQAFVRHTHCPWFEQHRTRELLAEDRPACDQWFASTLAGLNDLLGADLRFETLEALPEGGDCCLRRLWVEPRDGSEGGESDPSPER